MIDITGAADDWIDHDAETQDDNNYNNTQEDSNTTSNTMCLEYCHDVVDKPYNAIDACIEDTIEYTPASQRTRTCSRCRRTAAEEPIEESTQQQTDEQESTKEPIEQKTDEQIRIDIDLEVDEMELHTEIDQKKDEFESGHEWSKEVEEGISDSSQDWQCFI